MGLDHHSGEYLNWIQLPIESTQPEDIPGEPTEDKRITAS